MVSTPANAGAVVPVCVLAHPAPIPRAPRKNRLRGPWPRALLALALLPCLAPSAHASIFHGETLDKVANVLSWAVLVIVPIVAITAFWLVHILPDKIAEKRKHPQAKAIQVLCLLSLVFGGMLWPLAWLWAYSKPVLYKMAYGTDVDESHGHAHDAKKGGAPESGTWRELSAREDETARLRKRVAQLENDLRAQGKG